VKDQNYRFGIASLFKHALMTVSAGFLMIQSVASAVRIVPPQRNGAAGTQ
jgi:hypothetical protein